MCTNPRIIKNRRKHFIPYVDKEYISVPCGNCLECRNKMRNDLYILSYFEHLNALHNGGFTQFFTLTYDDENLPTYGFSPCFSREDVQGYFKRVTTCFKREFGKDFKFRRLVTCEYGTKNRRPHYHFLVFIQQPCNHYKVREILRRCWSSGFSFGSWDNFGEINRPSGIRYVTKYVCKDVFDLTEVQEQLEEAHEHSDAAYYQKKRVMPFCLHSKRYGFCALNHIFDKDSPLPEHLRTPLDVIIKTGCIRMYDKLGNVSLMSLPRTLYRQLFFSVTWRYKRVTKRDVELREIHGTKVPKHKVQSYYIPNHLYPDFYRASVVRKLDNLKIELSNVSDNVSTVDCQFAFLDPDYSFCSYIPNYSFENYVEKKIEINCSRDPIFERDPFDGSFSYRRAPLERSDFPEMRSFMLSAYDRERSMMLHRLNTFRSKMNTFSNEQNVIIEKTYRDNKIINTLKYA